MKIVTLTQTTPRRDPWDLRDGGGEVPPSPTPVGSPEAMEIVRNFKVNLKGEKWGSLDKKKARKAAKQ